MLERIRDHNLIPEVDQDGINELISLHLGDCDSLEFLVDTTKEHVPNRAFTNLIELSLRGMGGLKMLCNGPFPKGFLQNLKKLKVWGCDQLKEILEIDEGFYTREENQPQLLSNLEHLELESLPELRWIWKASAHYFSLQSLKVVKISWCEKLMSLFSPSLIQSLLQLEELQIKHCDKLKTLFGELESDGETESNPLCLPTLRTLFISDCERLEYLLPITLAQGLPQLEKLKIEGCDELKQVFGVAKENGVVHCIKLPRLKDLTFYHVNSVSSFCPENYFVKAPALEKLTVSGGNNRVHLEVALFSLSLCFIFKLVNTFIWFEIQLDN